MNKPTKWRSVSALRRLEQLQPSSLILPPCRVLATGEAGRRAHPFGIRYRRLAGWRTVGQAGDAAEARSMLQRLRGRVHQVYTAITLIDLHPASARRAVLGADRDEHAARPEKAPDISEDGGLSALPMITDLACSDVPMRNYTDAEIEAYIASGDPFDKAGAYAIQHAGFRPVENFSGLFCQRHGPASVPRDPLTAPTGRGSAERRAEAVPGAYSLRMPGVCQDSEK